MKESQVQRYLCRSCGCRFSNPMVKVNIAGKVLKQSDSGKDFSKTDVLFSDFSFKPVLNDLPFKRRENIRSHTPSNVTITEKRLNIFRDYTRHCRVCASETKAAKNLVKVESRTEKRAAGATTQIEDNAKSKIFEFAWWQKKNGSPESSIRTRTTLLKILVTRGANLFDPESVKETMAGQKSWSEGYKAQFVWAYDLFCTMLGMTWTRPRYKQQSKLPFIPTEKEIDQLIASCGPKTGTLLQTLKEAPMRIGEAWRLEWKDVDFENNVITMNSPEKDSKPRTFKVSSKLMARINQLPRKSQKIFGTTLLKGQRQCFERQRKRIAQKLQNPRIERIHFHTFRHWKATMEYHKTKDILYVKKLLGHKRLDNTLLYTQLVNFESDEFHVRVTEKLKEACELVEAGFEYVTDMDDYKIFRKRK